MSVANNVMAKVYNLSNLDCSTFNPNMTLAGLNKHPMLIKVCCEFNFKLSLPLHTAPSTIISFKTWLKRGFHNNKKAATTTSEQSAAIEKILGAVFVGLNCTDCVNNTMNILFVRAFSYNFYYYFYKWHHVTTTFEVADCYSCGCCWYCKKSGVFTLIAKQSLRKSLEKLCVWVQRSIVYVCR